jgi:hypothetical protein
MMLLAKRKLPLQMLEQKCPGYRMLVWVDAVESATSNNGEVGSGVGESAGGGVGGSSAQDDEGGVLRGGERCRSSSSPHPSTSALHRLFTAFLVHFASSSKRTGGDSGSKSSGNGGSGCEGSGIIEGGGAKTCVRGA